MVQPVAQETQCQESETSQQRGVMPAESHNHGTGEAHCQLPAKIIYRQTDTGSVVQTVLEAFCTFQA